MSDQWLRVVRLTVEGAGKTWDLSNFRIRFEVRQSTNQTPNALAAVINNLAPATQNAIQKEGAKVRLEAGYEGGYGQIFSGEIIQKRTGRENPIDTYLAIVAREGDLPYNFAVVNKTLAAGSTFRDHVNTAVEPMKAFGYSLGHVSNLGARAMPRARTFFGMARDALRIVAASTNSSWWVENGKVNMLKNEEFMPGDGFKVNSLTGMVGRPVVTFNGVIVRMLLNHRLRPGTRLEINEASIDRAAYDPAWKVEGLRETLDSHIAADGIYKIIALDHMGDTHGGPWYSEATCFSKSSIGTGEANKGRNVDQ